MLLFSFLLLFLLIVSFCGYKKDKRVIPVISIGVISAILVCSFKTLFMYSHRIVPFSFTENYIYLLFRQAVIPVVLLYALFCVISKDTLEYKIEAFFPLELAFFAIFLPHVIVSTSEGLYSSFSLFVKPVLFAVMLTQLGVFSKLFYKSWVSKKIVLVVLFIVASIVYLCIPALFETLYILKGSTFVIVIGSIIYALVPVTLITFVALRKIKF